MHTNTKDMIDIKILPSFGMLLLYMAMSAVVSAQERGTTRFDDIKGTGVLTAVHEKSKAFVTVSHTDDKRSCFMVENIASGVKKKVLHHRTCGAFDVLHMQWIYCQRR